MAQRKVQEIEEAVEEAAEVDASGKGIDALAFTSPNGEMMRLPDDVVTLRQLGMPANAGSLKNYAGYRLLIDVCEFFYPRDGKQNGVRISGRLVDQDDNVSMPATFISFSAPVRRTLNAALKNPANAPYGKEPNQTGAFEPPMLVAIVDQGVTFTIE